MKSKMTLSYILILTLFLLSSCILNPHLIITYKTDLPDINSYASIEREKFINYFIDDVYINLDCYSTDYYQEKIRSTAPFKIRFIGICKSGDFEKIIIDNVELVSNKGSIYSFRVPQEQIFNEKGITAKDGVTYYTTHTPYGQKHDSFNFSYEENEVITINAELSLVGKDSSVSTKQMTFVIKPNVRKQYFDYITDIF